MDAGNARQKRLYRIPPASSAKLLIAAAVPLLEQYPAFLDGTAFLPMEYSAAANQPLRYRG